MSTLVLNDEVVGREEKQSGQHTTWSILNVSINFPATLKKFLNKIHAQDNLENTEKHNILKIYINHNL